MLALVMQCSKSNDNSKTETFNQRITLVVASAYISNEQSINKTYKL